MNVVRNKLILFIEFDSSEEEEEPHTAHNTMLR